MLQTLPSRRADPASAASPVTGAYKVDINRGKRIGRVSSEWFSRADDERFLSLGALTEGAVRASDKGAELIAAKWADARKIAQVAFKPDWTSYAKADPFKRNDQMLDVLPIGVVVFPHRNPGQPRR